MSTPYVEMDQTVSQLRSALGDVYAVESSTVARTKPEAVIFRGKLLTDSDSAFDKIRPRFESLGFTPQLERMDGRDVVTAMPGIVRAHESNPLINLVLFVLTVASTFVTGGFYGAEAGFNVLNGVLFTVSLLTILGAHELGHYFVARHYNAPVTLPYFIPLPLISPIGTMGAVIRLKAPFVNRKRLFDVGIAGPLAGLVFAIPILFIGLSTSPVGAAIVCPPGAGCQEGNSIIYALAKYLVFGKFLPSGGEDVLLSPVAWAAWVGLFVTALNLLPAGQLDGGHIAFALFGRRARVVGWVVVAVLFVLALPSLIGFPYNLSFVIPGLYYPGYIGWFVWVGLIYLTGVNHPVPLNDISDLGMGRKLVGALAIVLFVLLFTPLPFS
jgi:membrane-associated protease RseP (regulator of RpoE activity)